MKVLAEGNWKNPWSMEIICTEKECGATLLAEEPDVKAPDYESSDAFEVECGVCGHAIKIKSSSLPLRIKSALNKKRKYSTSWD